MDDYTQQPEQPAQSSHAESTGGGGTATAARMMLQATQKAADLKDKVAGKINESRESAAGALDQTATTLHFSGDKVSDVAHSAANKIQGVADYVRRTDLNGMAEDIQDLVKRYPAQSLAAAMIVGFLVARGLQRRD